MPHNPSPIFRLVEAANLTTNEPYSRARRRPSPDLSAEHQHKMQMKRPHWELATSETNIAIWIWGGRSCGDRLMKCMKPYSRLIQSSKSSSGSGSSPGCGWRRQAIWTVHSTRNVYKNRQDPTIDAGARTKVCSKHALNITCVDFDD